MIRIPRKINKSIKTKVVNDIKVVDRSRSKLPTDLMDLDELLGEIEYRKSRGEDIQALMLEWRTRLGKALRGAKGDKYRSKEAVTANVWYKDADTDKLIAYLNKYGMTSAVSKDIIAEIEQRGGEVMWDAPAFEYSVSFPTALADIAYRKLTNQELIDLWNDAGDIIDDDLSKELSRRGGIRAMRGG